MRAMLITAMVAPLLFGCVMDRLSTVADEIEGREWLAQSIGGKPVIADSRVTLKIEGGRVSGKAGCNAYGGSVEINAGNSPASGTIHFGSLFSTKMACMANGLMQQESSYLNMLQEATRVERRDLALIVGGEHGTIEFRMVK